MFASRVKPDLFPYRVGKVRLAFEGTLNGQPTIYDPRTDLPQSNPTNPILKTFRESGCEVEEWLDAIDRRYAEREIEEWNHPGHLFYILVVAEPDQIDHAAEVLTLMKMLGTIEP